MKINEKINREVSLTFECGRRFISVFMPFQRNLVQFFVSIVNVNIFSINVLLLPTIRDLSSKVSRL